MRSTAIDRALVAAIATLAIAAASGCATTSIGSDLARVRELSGSPLPAGVDASRVDVETSKDVRDLLREPLTEGAAARVALLNNRELRAQLRDLGIARGQLVQAGLLPNPTILFDIRRPTDRTLPLQTDFEVEFDLTRAVLAPVRAGAARADLEAARYRSAAAVVETGFAARAAFFAVQAAQQRLVIATRVLDAFAASRDAAQALFKAGNVPELDFAMQDAAYQGARAAVAQMELEALDRRERVNRLLGLHGGETAWTVRAELPAAPPAIEVPEGIERRAVTASLELGEARSRLEAAARRTGLTRTEGWLPDMPPVDVHAAQDSRSFELGGGARISVPIFDRKQGAVAAREAEFDGMMERYQGAAVDIRFAARESKNRLVSAHMRARQYQEIIVPARKRVLEQTLLQYNAMQVGVRELLQAQRDGLDAELLLVEALRDLWTAKAAVDALLAGRRVGMAPAVSPMGLAGSMDSAGGH